MREAEWTLRGLVDEACSAGKTTQVQQILARVKILVSRQLHLRSMVLAGARFHIAATEPRCIFQVTCVWWYGASPHGIVGELSLVTGGKRGANMSALLRSFVLLASIY